MAIFKCKEGEEDKFKNDILKHFLVFCRVQNTFYYFLNPATLEETRAQFAANDLSGTLTTALAL
jgi:hypothetical protein